MFVLYMW